MTAAYLLAYAAIALAGAPAFFNERVRSVGPVARIAVCFATGAVALSIASLVLSWTRIAWSPATLLFAALAVSLLLAPPGLGTAPLRPGRRGGAAGVIVILAATGMFVLATTQGEAISIDYFYFWGVKGLRFAAHRTFDFELLRSAFGVHTHQNYPPLLPVTFAWTTLLAGQSWLGAVLSSALWLLASAALVAGFLRSDDRSSATSHAALWTVVLSAALTTSHSAGSAEPLLVFFAAGAVLSATTSSSAAPITGLFLAGCVLTKLEGLAVAGSACLGIVLRDLLSRDLAWRRWLRIAAAPAASLLLWNTFLWQHQLPLSDPARTYIRWQIDLSGVTRTLMAVLENADAGLWGIPWLLTAVLLVRMTRRTLVENLPALTCGAGTLLFTIVLYLGSNASEQLVVWTFPRLLQPALATLLIGGLSAGRLREAEAEAREPRSAPEAVTA